MFNQPKRNTQRLIAAAGLTIVSFAYAAVSGIFAIQVYASILSLPSALFLMVCPGLVELYEKEDPLRLVPGIELRKIPRPKRKKYGHAVKKPLTPNVNRSSFRGFNKTNQVNVIEI